VNPALRLAEIIAALEQVGLTVLVMGGHSLPDLIHSKETERDKDWRDVLILEEFLDSRSLNQATTGSSAVDQALARLRSRRGLETALQRGFLEDAAIVRQALSHTQLSITQAILLPAAGTEAVLPTSTAPLEPVLVKRLRTIAPASALHLALVEVVRRHYRQAMQKADAADKAVIRAAQANPPPTNP